MNTVLINPPIRLPLDFAHYPMFSLLSVVSNAAWLRERGRDVHVVDANALHPRLHMRPDGGQWRYVGVEVDELVDAVASRVPDHAARDGEGLNLVVTITMHSDLNRMGDTAIPEATRALRARFPKASIGFADLYIHGFVYFPYDPELAMKKIDEVDWCLMGEGEPTLPDVLDRLDAGESLEGLPRVCRRTGSGDVVFDARMPELIKPIDDFPLPAWDLVEMDNFFGTQADALQQELIHEYHFVERQLPMMSSRGCPYKCNFCTNTVMQLPFRAHSVDYVLDMVEELKDRYTVDRFLFIDDNINTNPKRFRELVMTLADRGHAWDAVNGMRADLLDKEMVQAIKKAGNTKITVSAETGDPEFLNKIVKKRLRLPKVMKLAGTCKTERIPLQVHYVVGFPGETKEQINLTLEFSTRLLEELNGWPLVQHAIPFPGTPLFQDCVDNDFFVAPPWEISGELIEVNSIIKTPEFTPEEIFRFVRNARTLHDQIRAFRYVAVESRCSNRCDSCHCDPNLDGADTPTRQSITAELEYAKFVGGRQLFLGGGEPTLRPDLHEIVTEARELGFEGINLITNAHGLADPGYAAGLFDARVDRLIVDLLGPDAKSHDAIAKRDGSFAGTVTGLRRAIEHGGIAIDVNVAVTRANLDLLAKTVKRARQLRAGSIHLQIPPAHARAAELGEIPLWHEALPHLQRAMAAAPEGVVTIQGAPLCLLPDQPGAIRPMPPWVLRRRRKLKQKPPECMHCVAMVTCGGFYRSEHEPLYEMRPLIPDGTIQLESTSGASNAGGPTRLPVVSPAE